MKKTDEPVVLARHIARFLNDYAPSQKTDSFHTLKSYRDALRLYIMFLEKQKKISSNMLCAGSFEQLFIEEWLVWLKNVRNCSPDTCNNRLASLRVFLKYLGSRESSFIYLYLEASEIPRRKTLKKKVSGLSREAVKTLLHSPDPSIRIGRRDRAFMILLYSTAARIDEILSMQISQLHLDGTKPYANIIGKGNKIRTLYLLPKVVAHLKQYINEFHNESPKPDAYLFYSRNIGIYGKMTQPAIDKMLKKYALSTHDECPDVPCKLHAHNFRHAKATHWLEDGINIVQISFLLGHEQIQTTMKYLDITTEDEAEALATLEEENDKYMTKNWKNQDGTLLDFCGFSSGKI